MKLIEIKIPHEHRPGELSELFCVDLKGNRQGEHHKFHEYHISTMFTYKNGIRDGRMERRCNGILDWFHFLKQNRQFGQQG